MSHPTQRLVESLHEKGACPRIHVDLTREGVVCPDFVREQWREQLVIDLDPTYPLDLAFTDDALAADLSFDGFVTRCVFPFGAIYIVGDRETGKGMVIEQNMPASVRRKRAAAPKPPDDAALRAQGKRSRPGKSRRRRRPNATAAEPSGPRLAAAPEPTADESEPAADAPEPSAVPPQPRREAPPEPRGEASEAEAEAQRRRSVFQVIDGDR